MSEHHARSSGAAGALNTRRSGGTIEHLTRALVRRLAAAEPVPRSVLQHLRSSCEPCHRLLFLEFDRFLLGLGFPPRCGALEDRLEALGHRYVHRHFCPLDLFEQLARGDAAATRHAELCPLCAGELADFAILLGPGPRAPMRRSRKRPP